MRCVQMIFSPTGGTEKAARAVTKNWPEVETVDLSLPGEDYGRYEFGADDVVLIAMPSFGGLAPQVALDRLARVRGNGAKCAVAAVYGNRAYEDTLVQMADAAEKSGFQVIAAVSAVAEHSIIRQYAAGRPDTADCGQLAGFGDQILTKARAGGAKPAIPGNRPYKKAGGSGFVPKADSACTACGLCAARCPVQAIDPKDPKTADGKRCISCMRCVSLCPQGARKVNGVMLSAAALALKKACFVPKKNELFL